MCGIAGIFHVDGAPADAGALDCMTRILSHRGPDGQGVHVDGAVGLGHRRLSIIDLSALGNQPMCNEDGSIWLTYNGEFYTHLELRNDLIAKGHVFASKTDSEAIIHGYEEYGVDVLQWMNGMFAFAIWDANRQRLFLARDRIGIKPLFYGIFENTFLFGSEVKAILEHPAARRELDTTALDLFLSLNYTPAPYTMLKGIRQLEPGQWLMVEAGSRDLKIESYWDVDYSRKLSLSQREAETQFSDLLDKAVRRRLMSDVPLGAFLSGGVDSSAVVACMTSASDKVETFSIGFGERTFNEAPYAKQVAEHLHTQHHEQIVTPDLAGILPKVVWHGEDPLADSSMIPVYYLSKMTREHVIVALAGDGADEILAGYPTYIATKWARRLSFLPHNLIQSAANPLLKFLPVSDEKISRREKLGRFINGAGLSWQDAHAVWRQIHTPAEKQNVLAMKVGARTLFDTYQRYYEQSKSDNMLDRLLYVDTRFYLPNDMIVKVDRMSMAHGLEARVPFLDHELVEFAAKLPSDFKLKNGTGKYILREVMKNRLPHDTLTRPKEGFNIPVSKWLREGLFELLTDTLSTKKLNETGIFHAQNIQKMIYDHQTRKYDYGHQLWGLLSFMLWWEQFMQGNPA